jgi:NADH-quinone oxidoreductase subunit J
MPSSWLFVLPLIAGAAAVYLLLPRPRAYPVLWGALLGLVALGLAGWLVVGFGTLTPESFLFYVFSVTAVGFGALLVTQRNPARAALSFALVVLSTCGLFLLLAAPFLMAATIIIYAGAVIVTFLFVLMLAQQEGPSDADARSREPMLAAAIGFVLLGALLYVLQLQWSYENNHEGQAFDGLLRSIADARAGLSEDGVKADHGLDREKVMGPLIAALGDDEQKLASLPRDDRGRTAVEREQRSLQDLRGRLDPIIDQSQASASPSVDEARAALDKMDTVVLQAKQQHGWPEPDRTAGRDRPSNLSAFSGPPPDQPADQVRTEADGRPPLPADNPGYLGRSLFTDYLLPVELGGFLLLAAAIGAIAIAHRRITPEGP